MRVGRAATVAVSTGAPVDGLRRDAAERLHVDPRQPVEPAPARLARGALAAPDALTRGRARRATRVLRAGAQLGRDLAEQAVVLAQQLGRAGPGERLDAAHVGGGGSLAEDVEHADLGGGAHVRAAAQLARVGAVADLDHAHDLAVLLAEQGHRAEAPGLLQGGGDRADGVAGGDPGVDGVLDVAQLLRAERAGVGEVEAQLVRSRRRSRPGGRGRRGARAGRRAGGGWRCGCARWRAARRGPRARARAPSGASEPCSQSDLQRLVVAEAVDVRDARPGSRRRRIRSCRCRTPDRRRPDRRATRRA